MQRLVFALALFSCAASTHAQFLKKIKEKVNKTIGNDDQKKDQNTSTATSDAGSNKVAWCDTIKIDGAGADGISYTKIYSGTGPSEIVYSESAIGLAQDPSGYRLILSQSVNGKGQFVVVENGKTVATDSKVNSQYLTGANLGDYSAAGNKGNDDMKRYIVADSAKHDVAGRSATTVSTSKVDDDQMNTVISMAHQTDDYKKLSDAGKKDFDDNLKKGFAINNSMAGKTYNVPGQQATSYTTVTGFRVLVNGKSYGSFMMSPAVYVSPDQASVFAVGVNAQAAPQMVTQLKKTALDKSKVTGMSGTMLHSPDRRKAVYIEIKMMSGSELENVSNGTAKAVYTFIRPDGTTGTLTDQSGTNNFLLSNSGAIINVNEATGEVYADGKKIGQFKLPQGSRLETGSLLIGAGNTNIAYFDGATGSLNYLDGTVRKMGILYPKVITQNGKTYITWFRKCHNDIYLGKIVY